MAGQAQSIEFLTVERDVAGSITIVDRDKIGTKVVDILVYNAPILQHNNFNHFLFQSV